MSAAIASIVFGLLGLAIVVVFPTLALLLGVVALATGLLKRRRLAAAGADAAAATTEARLTSLGIASGVAVIVATIVVVIVTTD